MKYAIVLCAVLSIWACNNQKKATDGSEGTAVDSTNAMGGSDAKAAMADPLNEIVPNEEYDTIMLGRINRNGLQQEPFSGWFTSTYDVQPVDSSMVNKIEPLLQDVSITVFMGTWCSDSQREIPHLYKILDAADFDYDKFTVYAVDDMKTTPSNIEEEYNIAYVPTIIFSKNGEEMDRFVEYAQNTLEEDIYAILSGAEYKDPYEE
ncbi:thioredoxin family protein [Luteirhabdus pelagi]|uniref:thioredoxin family protein n=1 Tax=Luteirhabdus pelagi TaxID=2792783 RepID=UPI00193A5DCE|nr:thioredoxin family protein [Luteirhabdus pelagi]